MWWSGNAGNICGAAAATGPGSIMVSNRYGVEVRSVNLSGRACPEAHPGWQGCVEELLFYTSRYASYAVQRLAAWADGEPISLDGFEAQRMTEAQRACMAQLLSRAPAPTVARAIGQLAAAVAAGQAGIPDAVHGFTGYCQPRPCLQLIPTRPRNSAGLASVDPVDALQHLARRYGFPVRVQAREIHIDGARSAALILHGTPRVRRYVQELLQALNRAGYGVTLAHLHHHRPAAALPVSGGQDDRTAATDPVRGKVARLAEVKHRLGR